MEKFPGDGGHGRRGSGRKAKAIFCGLLACVLAVALLSCRKQDLGSLIMAGAGLVDRISLPREPAPP